MDEQVVNSSTQVAKTYLNKELISQMHTFFISQEPLHFIQLPNFLDTSYSVEKVMREGTFSHFRQPLTHVYKYKQTSAFSKIVKPFLSLFFSSYEILDERVIQLEHKSYKMLLDVDSQEQNKHTHELIIDFSPKNATTIAYIPHDSDAEPLLIEPDHNTLTLIQAAPSVFKYTNHLHEKRVFVRILLNATL